MNKSLIVNVDDKRRLLIPAQYRKWINYIKDQERANVYFFILTPYKFYLLFYSDEEIKDALYRIVKDSDIKEAISTYRTLGSSLFYADTDKYGRVVLPKICEQSDMNGTKTGTVRQVSIKESKWPRCLELRLIYD